VICPTGIDIQRTASGASGANCIDACDEVMTRIDRPRGDRYDSKDSKGRAGDSCVRSRSLRGLGLVGAVVF
jgi:polyferredoxin